MKSYQTAFGIGPMQRFLKFTLFVELALLVGCTSSNQKSKVTFTIDPISASRFAKANRSEGSPSSRAASSAPANVNGFDCVFVNVMGDQIGDWTKNKSSATSNTGCGYLGTYSELVSLSKGGTATLLVEPGAGRIVQVLGVKSTVGCSKALDATSIASQTTYPAIYELGRAITDTYKDVDLNVQNTYSFGAKKDFRCLESSAPQTSFDPTPPVAGGSLVVSSVTNGIILSWPPATDNSTSAENLQYKVVRAASISSLQSISAANEATIVQDWRTSILSTAITGLSNGAKLALAVLVKDSAGNQTLYEPIDVTVDLNAPSIEGEVSATPGPVSVLLSWFAASDSVTDASQLQYKVVRANSLSTINTVTGANSATVVTDWTGNLTSTVASGLSSSTTYAFAVLVRDAAGNMTLYPPISVTTQPPDTTGPVAGGNFNAAAGQTTVGLSWSPATDDSTSSSQLEYKVVRANSTGTLNSVTSANNATTVVDWTANLTSATATGLTGSSSYAFNVIVRDSSRNMSIYTPLSITTTGSSQMIQSNVASKPSGESSITITSNSGLNSGFFLNGAYYQLVKGASFDYLMKLNLNGTVDTSFGTQGFLKIATVSGAPLGLTSGTTWQTCNGSPYFYWNNSGNFRLYRLNLGSSPVTITNLNASTNLSSGGSLNDLNCVGNLIVATWFLNSVTNCVSGVNNCVATASYDTVGSVYTNSGNISTSTVNNIATPFLDSLGGLWLYSFGHWFQQFNLTDLSLGLKKTWNASNNSLFFDGEQFSSANDIFFYGRAGGTTINFWSDTVSNIITLFTGGAATPTFTKAWGFSGGSISDSRFCRFGNNYLGYANAYSTFPNYTHRAAVFNKSGTSTTLSNIFNGGSELVLDSSNYTYYTGRYYLSIACDDLYGRGAFNYTDSSGLHFNLLDATRNNVLLSNLSTSIGSLNPAFSPRTTSYSLNYKISEQVTSLTVTPTTAQNTATVQVSINSGSFSSVTSGSASGSLSLSAGNNTIIVKVTAADGVSTQNYTITVSNGICSAGYYDNGSHLCVESGIGNYSTGANSNRFTCDNKPSNSHYTSTTATSSTCPWSCDTGFISNGEGCDSYPNATLLTCNDNEIAVGVNGRMGSIIDRVGLRCASLLSGQIVSSTRNGPDYGGMGGIGFNSDGSLDCPEGYALYTVKGNYAWYDEVQRTGQLQVRCINLTNGSVLSNYIPGNSSYWGGTADIGPFSFQCGSGANWGGTYVNGIIVDNAGGAGYTGKILGITCR